MFTKSWHFNYDLKCSKDNIHIVNNHKRDNTLLEKYHGFKLNCHELDDLNDLLTMAKDEIGKVLPIITRFDCFWCPWDPGYQKYHNNHVCPLVGIDEENKNLYISDPYSSKKDIPNMHEQTIDNIIEICKSDLDKYNPNKIIPLININKFTHCDLSSCCNNKGIGR